MTGSFDLACLTLAVVLGCFAILAATGRGQAAYRSPFDADA